VAQRDAFELALVEAALERGLPVLGMSVARGRTIRVRVPLVRRSGV
jgi:gamma-glutamyl-gamma-aminobutyrate hydrolase PuuD